MRRRLLLTGRDIGENKSGTFFRRDESFKLNTRMRERSFREFLKILEIQRLRKENSVAVGFLKRSKT
jgi:hypothetical protein